MKPISNVGSVITQDLITGTITIKNLETGDFTTFIPNKRLCTEETRAEIQKGSISFATEKYISDQSQNPDFLMKATIDVALSRLIYEPKWLAYNESDKALETLQLIAQLNKDHKYTEIINNIFAHMSNKGKFRLVEDLRSRMKTFQI